MAAILEELTRTGQASDEAAELAERVRASVVVVRGTRFGSGSGVVWNDQGLVITNHHVVPGERAEVVLSNGARLPARTTGHSETNDLAAVQIEGKLPESGLVPAAIGDSTRLRVGELVVAVGNPMGERNAVTMGMVSGAGMNSWFRPPREVLQVAITLRPGNSGGALADVQGRVVGIPNMVINTGMALAVPSHVVKRFLEENSRRKGQFGFTGQYVELPAARTSLGPLPSVGLMLLEVQPGSAAEQAGLSMGDILIDVESPGTNGRESGLLERLTSIPAGEPAVLTLIHAGRLQRIEVRPR